MLHLLIEFSFVLFYLIPQSFFFRFSLDRFRHLERRVLLVANSKDGMNAHNSLANVKRNLNEEKTPLVEVVLLRMWLVGVEGSEEDRGNKSHKDDVDGGVGDSSGLEDSPGLTGGSGTYCLDKVL